MPRAAWIALLLAVVLLFGPFLAIGVAFSNESAGEAMFFALIPVAGLALVFCLVGTLTSIGARSVAGVLMSLSPLPPLLLWLLALASSA